MKLVAKNHDILKFSALHWWIDKTLSNWSWIFHVIPRNKIYNYIYIHIHINIFLKTKKSIKPQQYNSNKKEYITIQRMQCFVFFNYIFSSICGREISIPTVYRHHSIPATPHTPLTPLSEGKVNTTPGSVIAPLGHFLNLIIISATLECKTKHN